MATKEPAPEKARSPWSPWGSRRAELPFPTAEVVTVELCSDEGDEEQPPAFDAPELDLDEDIAGDDSAELLGDRPGDGGEGSAMGASPRAPPMGHAQGADDMGRLALGRPTLIPSTDGTGQVPVATATAMPAISMAVEGRSLAVMATNFSGLGTSSSCSPGKLSEGRAIFAQARQVVD